MLTVLRPLNISKGDRKANWLHLGQFTERKKIAYPIEIQVLLGLDYDTVFHSWLQRISEMVGIDFKIEFTGRHPVFRSSTKHYLWKIFLRMCICVCGGNFIVGYASLRFPKHLKLEYPLPYSTEKTWFP